MYLYIHRIALYSLLSLYIHRISKIRPKFRFHGFAPQLGKIRFGRQLHHPRTAQTLSLSAKLTPHRSVRQKSNYLIFHFGSLFEVYVSFLSYIHRIGSYNRKSRNPGFTPRLGKIRSGCKPHLPRTAQTVSLQPKPTPDRFERQKSNYPTLIFHCRI